MTLGAESLDTPVGPLSLVTDEDGVVVACGFADTSAALFASLGLAAAPTAPREQESTALASVRAYFGGELTAIDTVEVRQPGTPLMQETWQRLRAQPAGAPLTYRELSPGAPRAAGRACAINRIGLFVPCHRVHRSDGSLGGYSWGLDVKRWLLDHEG
ncbi:methylated-DNA--[protein]-cysteine S-methyltransferase [Saccharopolyspora indica]|uniref:methylated-DNA--[protein]-cysteine S-methyltransferase n=1 Tax=Saccharopolyspora indica TaxID=1229659 RepID=UPI0022EB56E9|nr:methylated-DNA--[protein]-cysteine S-methyltransferase [Saccharopolyspora indica]MDA3642441.1 methylated-DNA--[protein]-cysteine S-methyltransferase [Saccharopolyspora indica]